MHSVFVIDHSLEQGEPLKIKLTYLSKKMLELQRVVTYLTNYDVKMLLSFTGAYITTHDSRLLVGCQKVACCAVKSRGLIKNAAKCVFLLAGMKGKIFSNPAHPPSGNINIFCGLLL